MVKWNVYQINLSREIQEEILRRANDPKYLRKYKMMPKSYYNGLFK